MRYVNIGLFKIGVDNQVITSGTHRSLLSIGHDHRIITDPSIPSSIGYPDVKTYLEREAQNGYTVTHMDQSCVITSEPMASTNIVVCPEPFAVADGQVGVESGVDYLNTVDNGDSTHTLWFPQHTRTGMMLLMFWRPALPTPTGWPDGAFSFYNSYFNGGYLTFYALAVTDLVQKRAMVIDEPGSYPYAFCVVTGTTLTVNDEADMVDARKVSAVANTVECPTAVVNKANSLCLRFAYCHTAPSSLVIPSGTTEVANGIATKGFGITVDDNTYNIGGDPAQKDWTAGTTAANQLLGTTVLVPPSPV